MRRAVALIAGACVILALVLLAPQLRRSQQADGSAAEPAASVGGTGLTPEQERELERIATLGYVAGTEPVSERTGV